MKRKKMKKIFIECPFCNDKNEGEIIGTNLEDVNPEDDIPYTTISLVRCKKCRKAILLKDELQPIKDTDEWACSGDERLWPSPEFIFDNAIPANIRKSLEEAYRCYKVRAYDACAVMCGKALEAVGKEYKVESDTLDKILKELKEKEIIDKRIVEWGDALRRIRNIGAHASTAEITNQDAVDLLEFIKAICEYIFVLTKRYDTFKARLGKKIGE